MMKIGITVIICNFIYVMMVFIIYSIKKKVRSMDNKLYSILIKFNIFGLILELLCCYFVYNKDISILYSLINIVVNRIFLINILSWLIIFTIYVIYITFNKDNYMEKYIKMNKKNIVISIVFIYLLLFGLVSILPLNYYNDGINVYSYGLAANVLLGIGGLSILIDIFCLLKNIKGIRNKKYLPVFVLIICMIIAFILRSVNPGLIVINSMFAFISVLMYFTIENPDLQVRNELIKNRSIAEKSIDEKSSLLFKMTSELKEPINNIIGFVERYKYDKKDNIIDYINLDARRMLYAVDNVLNINNINTKNIKKQDNQYNTQVFFSDLEKRLNMLIENHTSYTISETLPKSLNGDSIGIRQIVIDITKAMKKRNDNTVLIFELMCINRYSISRLVFKLSYSNIIIHIDEINEILTDGDDANEINGLKSTLKQIKLLGGTLNIRSDDVIGTEIVFTIDQKNASFLEKKIIDTYVNENRALLISDNEFDINVISKCFSNIETELVILHNSSDIVDKINFGEKYKFIIIEDEIKPTNAYTILQKIKNNKTLIPMIVILDKNKEFIKEHYIKDGFEKYILKSSIKEDTEKIINDYIG